MVTIAKGDIPVGLDLGSHEYEISPELAASYMAGVDDHHEWYLSESPFGAAVAPALLLHSEVYRFANWYLPNIYGNLHARQEWELFAPMSIGATVTTHSTIASASVWRTCWMTVALARFAVLGRRSHHGTQKNQGSVAVRGYGRDVLEGDPVLVHLPAGL